MVCSFFAEGVSDFAQGVSRLARGRRGTEQDGGLLDLTALLLPLQEHDILFTLR